MKTRWMGVVTIGLLAVVLGLAVAVKYYVAVVAKAPWAVPAPAG